MDQKLVEKEEIFIEDDSDGSPVKTASRVTGFIAAILPFVASIPPIAAWGMLMAIPLLAYIVLLFTSGPSQFFEALFQLFFGGFVWEQVIAVIGLAILLYSFGYMRIKKREGLISSGPYRLVRHPQYLGAVLFTLTLTTRSYWIATNTFGASWISPQAMIMLWFGTSVAYAFLAWIEELHLAKTFGSEYEQYRQKVGFMFPFVVTRRRYLEIAISILIPTLLLLGIVFISAPSIIPPAGPDTIPPNVPPGTTTRVP